MKKINFVLLPLVLISLIGCNNVSPTTTSESIDSSTIKITKFEERELPSPRTLIRNKEDLIYVLDYMSFYKLTNKVTLKIAEEYKDQVSNIKLEFNEAKEESLISDVFHIALDHSLYKDQGMISLELYSTVISTDMSSGNLIPIRLDSFSYNLNKSEEELPLEHTNKGELHVSDSEQLYYALCNNYLPIPSNKEMETLLNNIHEVLNLTYRSTNSNFDNLKNIYDYLIHEVTYDKVASRYDDFDIYKNQSYYLEGVFNNHLAVCDGKAKAYVVLCSYIGIPNVRIRAIDENLNKHAYNYVKLDDTWYLSDSTNGSKTFKINQNTYQVPNYEMFLTSLETAYESSWTYVSNMHTSILEKVSKTPYDYFKNENLVISSYEEVKNLITTNLDRNNFSIEFQIENQTLDILDAVQRLDQELPSFTFEALQNMPKDEGIYTILIFKK